MLFDFCIFILHPRQRSREYEHIQKQLQALNQIVWHISETKERRLYPRFFFSISYFALDPFSIRFLIPIFSYFRMKFSKRINTCYGSNQNFSMRGWVLRELEPGPGSWKGNLYDVRE
ncbi:hypothetical protein EYC80_005791 [Monilinia laxa]|uniref:Uncharacterized protein n=1 Tax=Monilinia laxa TaxID=61186 RepID=A0A5N6KF90_MONLA|nr:hypothetical protein EYC80_005791 [Monilinia laxa]